MDSIQALWIGERLSTMEQLSIRSFLAQGHAYELYTYEPVKGMPEGVTLRDAAEILPPTSIFRSHGYYAGFSDFFRWKLLSERGGWWVDLDVVALRPFEFPNEYVFSSQHHGALEIPTSGIARAPASSEAFAWMWQICETTNKSAMGWGDVGPDLVRRAIERFRLQRFLQPAHVFCPIRWQESPGIFVKTHSMQGLLSAHALQLWGSMWSRAGVDRDRTYPADCLYEQLKQKYL